MVFYQDICCENIGVQYFFKQVKQYLDISNKILNTNVQFLQTHALCGFGVTKPQIRLGKYIHKVSKL